MTIYNSHYQQTKAYSARLDRQLIQDIFRSEGILYDADLLVAPSSGTTVSVAPGRCLVQGDSNSGQGLYRFYSDAAVTRTHTPDATNPRIDLIVAAVHDATEVGSGTTISDIEVVPGTATAGATAANLTGGPGQAGGPAIPATQMPIAYVRVPTAGAIVSGDIVDARPRTGDRAGLIVPTMRSTPDDGYLMCDGSLVRRVTYARLAAIMIAITGHAGDGSTTFKLPFVNNGRVLVGRDGAQTEFDVLGETGGEKAHVLTTAELAAHAHTGGAHTHGDTFAVAANNIGQAVGWNVPIGDSSFQADNLFVASSGLTAKIVNVPPSATVGYASGSHAHTLNGAVSSGGAVATANSGSGGSHNNLQPYQVCNFQIRA